MLWKIPKIHRGTSREGQSRPGASGPHFWPQVLMHFCFYSGCLDGVQAFHHDRSIVGGEFAVNKNPELLLTRVFYKALACFLIWKIRCCIGFPVKGAFLTKTHNQIIPHRCYIPCMSADSELFILMECKCECALKKRCFLNLHLQQKKNHYKCFKWMVSGFCRQVSHKLSLITVLASKSTYTT